MAAKYGNLFDMYERITGENPYEVPMRIYPAVHYTMGGLWVDYNLQSTIPGLFVTGEANFSDHGANRLGASALMQGLADGYFVLPTTIGDYLAGAKLTPVPDDAPEVAEAEAEVAARLDRLLSIDGHRTVDSFHRELGHIMWDYCGMERSDEGLRKALDRIPELRREFWSDVKVPGVGGDAEPVAREGRPRRRLPRARRADVPRRAAPHRELRRPLPRGEPDRRRRGQARRRELLLRRRLGVHRPGPGPGPPQGGPRLRVRHPQPAELQMKLKLKVWRQNGPDEKGRLVDYVVDNADEDMSFLELIDVLNEKLILEGEEPVAFDQDCREGICGSCDMVVNGYAHGPQKATTVCQLHLRHFKDGETVTVEPWRSVAFPVLKDLVVDRSALDRIIAAGGYISAPTGSAPEAASTPVPKPNADRAFTAAACIQCGACVAACPNGSASLFLGSKIAHLARAAPGPARAVGACGQHGRAARRRGFRRLHQHRPVHGGLPEGDPARRDRHAQPRLPARDHRRQAATHRLMPLTCP